MKPVLIDPEKDLAPIPFDENIKKTALKLKQAGLPWKPGVGCFVWDPEKTIRANSPFPGRIYMILSMPRFLEIFSSTEAMVEKLVWLPTWNQARTICQRMDIDISEDVRNWFSGKSPEAGEELEAIYRIILNGLRGKR